MRVSEIRKRILESNDFDFEELALKLFKYQSEENSIYHEYLKHLNVQINSVTSLNDIPCLPIAFFKSHKVVTSSFQHEAIFESSGTTATVKSKHYISSLSWYDNVSHKIFTGAYGSIEDHCFLALLPSYLERNNSSLIRMVQSFINKNKYKQSGFYNKNFDSLARQLQKNERDKISTILFGVTFALLDFAEKCSMDLRNTTIIETGGMKGRRKELTRQEVHNKLKHTFGLKNIHSEYGMTELLSQAYSKNNGVFKSPSWMKIVINEMNDPLSKPIFDRLGRINIIDLANIDSCAFIQTDDVGKAHRDGTFQVLGRIDGSDLRGCNLMITEN